MKSASAWEEDGCLDSTFACNLRTLLFSLILRLWRFGYGHLINSATWLGWSLMSLNRFGSDLRVGIFIRREHSISLRIALNLLEQAFSYTWISYMTAARLVYDSQV